MREAHYEPAVPQEPETPFYKRYMREQKANAPTVTATENIQNVSAPVTKVVEAVAEKPDIKVENVEKKMESPKKIKTNQDSYSTPIR